MAGAQTIVRVVSQKFFSQLKNGDDFSENTSDYTTHLKAGIGETVRAQIEIQVGAFAELSNFVWQVYDGGTRARIDMSGGGFRKAFSAGDSVRYNEGDAASSPARGALMTVTSVEDDHVEFDIVSQLLGGFGANNNSAFPTYEAGWITNISDLNGLEYKFGIIENDESTNYISKLTNIEELYRVPNVPLTSGTGQKGGVYAGENKAAQTGHMNVDFIGKVDDNNLLYQPTPFMSWSEYRIKHTFDVLPTYRDGDTDSIEKTDIPPDDIYNGSLSLKYVFQSSFMRTITDVNSRLIGGWDTTEGSVGYFGESFNGHPTTYSLDSVTYFDETDSIDTDRLNVTNTVRVNCLIDDSSNSFENGNPVVVWHSAIVDSDVYTLSNKSYKTLWTKESIRNTIGDAANSNDFIKDFSITRINSGKIEVEFDVDFTATQQGILEDGQPYILAVVCEQDGETTDTGGKTTILIDFNEYNKNSDIDGLLSWKRFEHFSHPNDWVNSATSTGKTNAKVDIEEGMLSFGEFSLHLDQDAELTGLNFELHTYNTVTGEYGIIREVPLSLGEQIVSNGVQEIILDETRGYKLKEGDQFNYLKLNTTDRVVDEQFYEMLVGWRMPWQKWLEYINADTVFYDRTEPLNNLNQFAATYSKENNPTLPNSDPNDYVLRARIVADVKKGDVTTEYRLWSENFEVYDYDKDDQPPSTYTCEISTHNEQGIKVEGSNGVLVFDKDFTEVRGTFTPLVPPVFSTNIDFTLVATTWPRFAFGNQFDTVVTTPRSGVWANQTAADANDTFTGTGGAPVFNKDSVGLYTSGSSFINSTANCGAFYGCSSIDQYEAYTATGKMSSTATDNDGLLFQICFFVDQFGGEHTLSFAATTGGIALAPNIGQGFNPAYIPGDATTTIYSYLTAANPTEYFAKVALVYNFGKDDAKQLALFDTTESGFGWGDAQVGDLEFKITRSSDQITAELVNWTINGNSFSNTFNFNLNDDPLTEKFLGYNNIGFGFMSQDQGGFKDVVIEIASEDYWAKILMTPKDAASDSDPITISTLREQDADNGLIQLNGDLVLASLDWVDPSFLVRAKVNPDTFDNDTEYVISSQIGNKNI